MSRRVAWTGLRLGSVAAERLLVQHGGLTDVIVSDIPQITCEEHMMMVELGSTVRIACRVKANPPPQVAWHFINKNETIENTTVLVSFVKVQYNCANSRLFLLSAFRPTH